MFLTLLLLIPYINLFMKKLLPVIVIFVAILSIAPSASAYGGGNGFPPGYYLSFAQTNGNVRRSNEHLERDE